VAGSSGGVDCGAWGVRGGGIVGKASAALANSLRRMQCPWVSESPVWRIRLAPSERKRVIGECGHLLLDQVGCTEWVRC